jgi:hypothetical protein
MKGEHMNLYPAVGSTVFRLKRSFSAVVSLFRYSLETHPECFRDSNTQGCLTLHFANNRNEKRAKPLKTVLPTAVFRMKQNILIFFLLFALVLPGCSGDKAAELYNTAGFEELQNNREHSLKLYQEIIKKYPNSEYAKEAEERIEEMKRSSNTK